MLFLYEVLREEKKRSEKQLPPILPCPLGKRVCQMSRTFAERLLYTRDGLALAYLENPRRSDIDLFLKMKRNSIRQLHSEYVKAFSTRFNFSAVCAPFGIFHPFCPNLSDTLTGTADMKQKELLKQEIVEMSGFGSLRRGEPHTGFDRHHKHQV